MGASRSSPDPDKHFDAAADVVPFDGLDRGDGGPSAAWKARGSPRAYSAEVASATKAGRHEGEGMTEAGRTLGQPTIGVAVVLWAVNAVLLVVYLIWGRRTRDKGSEGQKDKGKNRDQ